MPFRATETERKNRTSVQTGKEFMDLVKTIAIEKYPEEVKGFSKHGIATADTYLHAAFYGQRKEIDKWRVRAVTAEEELVKFSHGSSQENA